MKLLVAALLLSAASVAIADSAASQSGAPERNSQQPSGDPAAPAKRDTGSTWGDARPAAADDDDSDETAWSTTGNINYDTGAVCITKGAGGICLESDD